MPPKLLEINLEATKVKKRRFIHKLEMTKKGKRTRK